MANIYDVEGIDQFLPEQKKSLSSFLDDYATTAQEVSSPYVGMAGKYGFGDDPAKIQGLGSDVRHTTGSALGKFGIQDYLSQFGLQPTNPVSNFIGNAGIMGSTAVQEIGDAIRGFKQAGLEGAINQPMEDVKANFRAMDIPYGTSLEDIVNMSVKGSPSAYMANAPEEVKISRFNAPGPFNYGTAQAAEVTPQTYSNIPELTQLMDDVNQKAGTTVIRSLAEAREYANQNRPNMSDIAGMGDLGNPTGDPRVVSEEMGMVGGRPVSTGRPTMADIAGDINLNMTDLGNPTGDPRIASEEQGLSGFPGLGQVDPGFQNALNAREARMNEIAMQQNPDYGQFFDAAPLNEEKKGISLGGILNAAALFGGPLGFAFNKPALSLAGAIGNVATGRFGRAVDGVSRGLGSLNRAVRGYNPMTGRTNTQADYEANRSARQTQSRIDNMLERKAKGLSYSQKNLDRLTAEVNKGINQREAAALADKTKSTSTGVRTDIDVADGGAEAGGGGKIVCTMMNERYGFGSFRNKIWMKFHEHHGPEYQKGYHAIFLPLVKIAKGKGKINTAVRKVLEHMGRHVTADMFKIMKGKKRDTLGRIYRAIFEPACHIIGKIKSALGRG
jgi:hypothetical protein